MTYSDIIVAVHGVGDQMRNETIRSVATRLARIPSLAGNHIFIAPQPLGYFYRTDVHPIPVSPIDRMVGYASPLSRIGFSEVYWADVPNQVLSDGHTMEETKAWARTVVSRARAVFHKSHVGAKRDRPALIDQLRLQEPDFGLASEVIAEMIDTIAVLENLCFLAEKAGVVKFNLRSVLEKYVDDVQVVTEFEFFRNDIIGRFHRAMEQIHEDYPDARLHIVAHSEGTVISFLGLLHAMCGTELSQTDGPRQNPSEKTQHVNGWFSKVSGYMTIGSPIDKHLLLWPELFGSFDRERLAGALAARGNEKIKWRNYYDHGDPIGFKLNTARKWLAETGCNVFEFDGSKDDIGFSRYLWPGKAHTDYWTDPGVFEHFMYDVVIRPGDKPAPPVPKPATRRITEIFSVGIPYLASFLILFVGTMLFCWRYYHFIYPPLDPSQNYVQWMAVGDLPSNGPNDWDFLRTTSGLVFLIAGVTLLARWPRIVRGWRWRLTAALAFFIGCLGYIVAAQPLREEIGSLLFFDISFVALLVAMIGWLSVKKPEPIIEANNTSKFHRGFNNLADTLFNTRATRRSRWFSKQMRPMIFTAGAIIVLILLSQTVLQRFLKPVFPASPHELLSEKQRDQFVHQYFIWKTKDLKIVPGPARLAAVTNAWNEANHRADSAQKMLEVHPPIWPVALAGLAFLYLWWLAALLFDLTFVWHWYIRRSKLPDRLNQWRDEAIRAKTQAQISN